MIFRHLLNMRIETFGFVPRFSGFKVAPYVGAWIETPESAVFRAHVSSHPMWVRGLKH